ncbi:8b44b121-b50f-46f8-bd44-054ad29b38bc [Thermothielavioides terrestris]|uniref:8b44b121-b50f-46f8-bd44-054ad29b38bc n=1 Tax=Thermothielavioides terrestris TaxID=2587410 RepID=A0A446BLF0_9PEZI|nr:8b44b121-b50f-46f8-bd44-054ad29b38bc [Thermothielavioides terrestris]
MSDDDPSVGWQASPDRRGTLTLLTSCLVTIFACTWSVQHLNLPGPKDGAWTRLVRKCKWMIITVLFPEFILAHAIFELAMAIDDLAKLKERGAAISPPWWLRLAQEKPANLFSSLAGVMSCRRRNAATEESEAAAAGPTPWTLTHCYLANMGGFSVKLSPQKNPCTAQYSLSPAPFSWEDYKPKTASQLAKLWSENTALNISEAEVADKSKTDYLSKAVAVVQIANLAVSVVVRSVRHLAISQLEIVTLAFAVCGVLAYAAYWYKPQGVEIPVGVELRCRATELEQLRATSEPRPFDRFWEVVTNRYRVKFNVTGIRVLGLDSVAGDWDRVPNDNLPRMANQTHSALFVLTFLTVSFGAIHLAAWNFSFPSRVEQILWRVSTIVAMVVPPLALLALPLVQLHRRWGDPQNFIEGLRRALEALVFALRNPSQDDDLRVPFWKQAADLAQYRAELAEQALQALRRLPVGWEMEQGPSMQVPYKDVFEPLETGMILCTGLAYMAWDSRVCGTGPLRALHLPKQFDSQLTYLAEILLGAAPKKIRDDAVTGVYPRRPLIPPWVNMGIIYVTGLVYCMARLSIIALAFSCLRSMPNSVYVDTWTKNIPSFQ